MAPTVVPAGIMVSPYVWDGRTIVMGNCFSRYSRVEPLFAGDLVPAVLPVRVYKRRGLRDGEMRRRLLVRAGGADENVLRRPAAEKRNVRLQLLRGENEPVHHGVEAQSVQRRADRGGVLYVGNKLFRPSGQELFALPPVQEISSIPFSTTSGETPELMIPVPPMNNTRILPAPC